MIRRLFLAVLVMCFASSAWAGGSPPVTKVWYTFEGKAKSTTVPTDGDCGGVQKPSGTPAGSTMGGPIALTSGTIYCRVLYNGSIYGNKIVGSYGSETLCEPDPSVQPVGGICPSYCPKVDTYTRYRFSYGAGQAGLDALRSQDTPTSNGACNMVVKEVVGCWRTPSTNVLYCDYMATLPGVPTPGVTDGTKASASTNAPQPANTELRQTPPPLSRPSSADTCPAGSVDAGVDSQGITKCVGMGTAPVNAAPPPPKTTLPTTTTTNADGSTTTTSTVKSTNADGSVTTTTNQVTVLGDGTSTTKVEAQTGPTASGSDGKADDPNDVNDLCKRNPLLNICKNSSVAGTCEAISCMGDAIQCATLRAAAAMQCKQKQDELNLTASPLNGAGVLASGKSMAPDSALPTLLNGSAVAMPSTLDSSGWLGGGSFFADKVITVRGQTITIPFAKYGQYLLVFRYALMIGALLVAFRILSGVIFKE